MYFKLEVLFLTTFYKRHFSRRVTSCSINQMFAFAQAEEATLLD